MDVDKLMKNDELSNRTRSCTKENDQNCHCPQCLYTFQNGIINPKENFLNDEKSLASSLPNSLNQSNLHQPQQSNSQINTANSSPTNTINSKKTLNPLISIKNFINSTTGHSTLTISTNKQTNSINNSSTNTVNCLNHTINHSNSDSQLRETTQLPNKYQENDLNSLHDDDNLNLLPNLNEWYTHCHLSDRNKLISVKTESANRRLLITTILCGFFLITELVGGYISNSLSIMTDAAHLLSDIVSFGLSLFAVYLSKKRATKRFTFGYQRAEILGAICKFIISDRIRSFLNLIFLQTRFNLIDLDTNSSGRLFCNYSYYNHGFRN